MSAGRNSRAFEDSEESSVDTMLSMPIAVPAITEQHLSVDASECPKEGEIEDLPCELLASMLSMPSWTEAGSEFALGASAPSESGSSDGAEDCWNLDSKGKAVSPAQEARLADAQAAAQARYGSSSSSSSSSISSRGGEKPKQGWMAQKVKTFFAGSGTGSRAAGGHMLDGAGSDRWGSKNSKRRSSTGIFGFGSGRSGGGGGGGGSGGGGGGGGGGGEEGSRMPSEGELREISERFDAFRTMVSSKIADGWAYDQAARTLSRDGRSFPIDVPSVTDLKQL
jgi:hypothetical protein